MELTSGNKTLRVAVYGRVSTEHEAQISALGNQIQYYQNIINEHPDWTLVEQYIDEGITGTSYRKRPSFLKMIEDAKKGKFDLIITREVCRFARNTVDTLVYTRELKKHGVEVYFVEDNIWTIRDDDGELRLTIMATLAQNESKKVSERVKAGQMISFQNGVLYGNGNILGYDRIGREFVINEEQAETVRMIFNLYEQGHGIRHIQFALEQAGRKTATGLTRWHAATINHVIDNKFYCGIIEYNKQYVPDFLEQHKINNHGAVERTVIQGSHPIIISKEQFDRCQEIKRSRSQTINNQKVGLRPPVSVWVSKLKCSCGGTWNRKVWHTNKDGVKQYAFQCYKQIRSGTVATRQRKGLSIDGVCTAPMIPQWKLDICASELVKFLLANKKQIVKYANDTLQKYLDSDEAEKHLQAINDCENELLKIKDKLSNLIDLEISGDITKDVFRQKQTELQRKVDSLSEKADREMAALNSLSSNGDSLENRVSFLKSVIEDLADFDTENVPDYVIDALIREVLVDGNDIHITLNGNAGSVDMELPQKKKDTICIYGANCDIIQNIPHLVDSNTGCYQQQRKVESKLLLCTLKATETTKKEFFAKHKTTYTKTNKWQDFKIYLYI